MSRCRFCGSPLHHVFVDLGKSPVANSFRTHEQLDEPEEKYPLKVFVCEKCFLVQLEEFKSAKEIFKDDYAYFSSYSVTWLKHAENYAVKMIQQHHIDFSSRVIEIASNDGYLLQYFLKHGIPVLGIEPSSNTAAVAESKGIHTITDYFTSKLAADLVQANIQADLLIGNNVLAHVPNLHDFVEGMKILLSNDGIITMEFPHLLQLVDQCQFDTIYHEHYSYFSFYVIKKIFAVHDLELFDVEEIPTHGGSLRIYAKHKENETLIKTNHVENLLLKELSAGINSLSYYQGFQPRIEKISNDFVDFLQAKKEEGKKVAGYGAAAKGNTLLNYCEIGEELLQYVVDRSEFKKGKFLPGSHIPVVDESMYQSDRPDYIVIFPWNIKDEIESQLFYAREWDAKFVVAIPELKVW